ncbi:MAG: ABC-F family ATP-binding cassette domain-containing protein [Candidatus Rokubacteria bacterium]|nr:ABC-F family ATP-binding cassette domain-containing protein [Candidatus Rokubacteria bacterium]
MIQLDAVSKSYAGQLVFRDLSWRIPDGERIGLVGPNGSGKTTLCRLLAGVETPDAGRISRPRATTVGYLPQEVAGSAAGSILAEALAGFEDVWRVEREMEDAAAALATATPGPEADLLTARYGDLQHRFEALGGYRLETQAKTILGGLGFRPGDFARPLAEFSGGWRMRAALARLLLLRPALLLLDEPTNHLDIESLEWLEGFLVGYEGTVVLVSHDRWFLNRMVTSIAELGPEGVTVYPGDYDHYLVERAARRELLEARARNQAKRVAEIERFIERFRYQATKARQVQSRIKMLERLERVEVGPEARRIRFGFPEPPRTGRRVAALAGLHKAYGDNVVYAGVDVAVERGERVALVGPNGSGKSTLLRILAGVLPFDRGERTLGAHVAVHYYAQHQLDALTPARTIYEELEAAAPELGQTRLRTIAGAFLFSGDAVDKKIAVLSGGEKARVALAKMLVRPAALLCLDEPTNHLDLAAREVLENALVGFPGTIVFISHDRYFINRLATRIVEVGGGTVTSYLGGYDDYLAAKARAAAPPPAAAARRAPRAAAPVAEPRQTRPRRPPRVPPEVRELRRRLDEVERQIHALEARLAEIGRVLADPALYADGERVRAATTERKSAEERVMWLMREWEALSEALAVHE